MPDKALWRFFEIPVQDRHALGEYEPIIEENQDVTLLSANQNDTHTILRFSRPYVTCDENDRDITVIIRGFLKCPRREDILYLKSINLNINDIYLA